MPCFVAFRSHAESWALKKAAGPVRFAAFDLDGNGRGCLEGGQSAFPKGSGRHRGLEPRECMCMVDALARRELGCFPICEIVALGAAARFNHPGAASRIAGADPR